MAKDDNQTDKHNITKTGERFQATVTRYFDDMDKAVQWAESTYTTNAFPDEPNGEPAASDMTPVDAEALNSQVNPAPIPAGAEQVLSGGGSGNDTDPNTSGSATPSEAADQLAVNNTAAGTHDPSLDTETTQVPATDSPEAAQPSPDTNSGTTK